VTMGKLRIIPTGPIYSGIKFCVDDGLTDQGPDKLAITPVGGMVGGVGGFVGNGTDAACTIGTSADVAWWYETGLGTAAAWVKCPSLAATQIIFGQASTDAQLGVKWTISATPALKFDVSKGSGGTLAYEGYAALDLGVNKWGFIVVVANGSQVIQYLNGAVIAGQSSTWNGLRDAVNASRGVSIGYDEGSASKKWFTGPVRGARMWDRPLSASELAYLYKTEAPAFAQGEAP